MRYMLIPVSCGRLPLALVPKSPEEVLLERMKSVKPGQQGIVAELAGITPNHYSRVINGKVPFNPGLDVLKGMAAALGMTLAELFTDPDDGHAPPPLRPSPAAIIEALTYLASAQELLTSGEPETIGKRARAGARRTAKRNTRARRGKD
jgi:transcriptional regulator with XRE-family HTH domain